MKIYFDVSTLNPQKVTGVGVYMLELIRHLVGEGTPLIPVVKPSRLGRRGAIERLLGRPCEILLPWKIFPDEGAIYHGPDFKLNTRGRIPRVVTVHDTVVFEKKYNQPEFFERGIRDLSRVLNSPLEAVIVNSKFTETEVLKHFPKLRGRTHVTYLGCDRPQVVSAAALALPEKYLLVLGTLEKRKNIVGAIRAFEQLKKMGLPHQLVLAGGWGFGREEIEAELDSSAFKHDIVRLGYVDASQLAELYRRAALLFFPSWYEGFGIPALEAMNQGLPVVASQGGALEEVCGEAALLVDPTSPEQMAETLRKLLSDAGLSASLKTKGLVRAKEFTWERCADQTKLVYHAALAAAGGIQ